MLKYLWQLPQNLLGYIVKKLFRAGYYCKYQDAEVCRWKMRSGLSLGKYIFVPNGVGLNYIKHEYGHCVQSKYLGWLYLLVIGLPSIVWAGCFEKYRKKHNVSYYAFYTEKWANKLGGIDK